jgi:hypothetical protein
MCPFLIQKVGRSLPAVFPVSPPPGCGRTATTPQHTKAAGELPASKFSSCSRGRPVEDRRAGRCRSASGRHAEDQHRGRVVVQDPLDLLHRLLQLSMQKNFTPLERGLYNDLAEFGRAMAAAGDVGQETRLQTAVGKTCRSGCPNGSGCPTTRTCRRIDHPTKFPAGTFVLRACKTISWANMKEQRSEARLLFHASTCKKFQEPPNNPSQIACGLY